MNKKFTILTKIDKTIYFRKKSNDDYLSMLAEVFEEGTDFVKVVKEYYLQGKDVTGNQVDLNLEGDTTIIQPNYEDPEEAEKYAITLKTNDFLDIIDQWVEAVKQNPDQIILERDDNYNVTIRPIFDNK